MTRKRQLLSNSIRLRIRLRGKQQLALSGVPDLMELAAELLMKPWKQPSATLCSILDFIYRRGEDVILCDNLIEFET